MFSDRRLAVKRPRLRQKGPDTGKEVEVHLHGHAGSAPAGPPHAGHRDARRFHASIPGLIPEWPTLSGWLRPQCESASNLAVGRFEMPPGMQVQGDNLSLPYPIEAPIQSKRLMADR
jgi:hypothetical protein